MTSGRTAVYRFYDTGDALLYIGIADKIGRRWDEHARSQLWWGEVQRQTVTWYDHRSEAERVEVDAIRDEHPRYNVRGNGFIMGNGFVTRTQVLGELERKWSAVNLGPIQARPESGWIRVIREALGMSQAVLARRLGIGPASVHKLERAEPRGGISVNKMNEVAAALNCTFVYALVPKSPPE